MMSTGAEALGATIRIVAYDPRWPEMFQHEADKIRAALEPRALLIEHVGSTSVPGLAAKPVIDVVLVVADSADEPAYAPALQSAGYRLHHREPDWFEHRMFKWYQPPVNLHVFSEGCPELERMLLFRDWLRINRPDRELYAQAKLELAQQRWNKIQEYADAKTAVVREIIERARVGLRAS